MNKKFVFVALMIFVLGSFVSADNLGTFKKGQQIRLIQTCDECTYCNITTIQYPNSSFIPLNNSPVEMNKTGTLFFYLLNKSFVTELGSYRYCYDCGNNLTNSVGCIDFEVTYTGKELSSGVSVLYVGLLALGIILFVVTIWFIPKLPKEDNRNEEGLVISINELKYLRPVLMLIAWLLFLSILFISSNIAIAYLPGNMFGQFLFTLFKIAFGLTFPIIVIWFIYLLKSIFEDRKTKQMLERGVFGRRW